MYRKETHFVVIPDSHRYIVGELGACGSQDTIRLRAAERGLKRRCVDKALQREGWAKHSVQFLFTVQRGILGGTRVDCGPDIPVHFYKRAEIIPVRLFGFCSSDAIKVFQLLIPRHTRSIFCARLFRVTGGPHGKSSLNPLAAILRIIRAPLIILEVSWPYSYTKSHTRTPE